MKFLDLPPSVSHCVIVFSSHGGGGCLHAVSVYVGGGLQQFTPLTPRGSDLHSSALKENIYSPLIAVFRLSSLHAAAAAPPLVHSHSSSAALLSPHLPFLYIGGS